MRVEFADLTFDADTRQVWSRGEELRLSPKAFDLLALLIERRPHAVSKADIHARLWHGTFVSDSSLPSLVSEIRDAIADHARKPGLIRTVPRFGYAFRGAPAPAGPSCLLIGASAQVPLLPGENVIGREGPGVIALRSSTVSRRHARIAIDAAGARLLYLPPYSPDLNPIEMAFAKLKAALRKAAARSIDALVDAIAVTLAAFTAQECLNFFAAAGYDRV